MDDPTLRQDFRADAGALAPDCGRLKTPTIVQYGRKEHAYPGRIDL